MTRSEIERRALAILEELADHPDDRDLETRLLVNEDSAVVARVRKIAAMTLGAVAMPTDVPQNEAALLRDPPERFGPFRIVAPIGRGGMGEVWRGERDDGLFDQIVAIKLIQPHLQVRAGEAFESERRILAGLDQPNIARLIDGGTTPDGRACLVMEYIDGVAFDAGCAPLPLDARISLFRQVLEAVGYAHGRLIAHGDLKPSNILVDRAGRVRLLDFGIARLVTDPLNTFRLTGAVTSSFASPARLLGEPPTIPDDVFALGRLLRQATADDADRDLTAIASKASADDEATRYGSVADLAADLERWAKCYPVRAVPGTPWYVARRYVRRNWAVVSAFIVMAALTIVAGVSYTRAEAERRKADTRFVQARAMANYMLFDLYDTLTDIPRTVTARGRIAQVSQRNLNQLNAGIDTASDIRLDLAKSYARLAEVQGIYGNSNLGQSRAALANIQRADTMLTNMHTRQPERADIAAELAKVRIRLANANIYGDHDPGKALALAKSADSLLTPGHHDPADPAARDTLWWARIVQADALTWLDRTAESLALLHAELALSRRRQQGRPISTDVLLRQSQTLRMIGEAEYYAHHFDVAVAALRQGLTMLQARYGTNPEQPSISIRMVNIALTLGTTQIEQGQLPVGVDTLRYGYGLASSLSARDPNDGEAQRRLLSYAGDLAGGLVKLGRLDEADRLILETRAAYFTLLKRHPDDAALFRAYARSIRSTADLKRRQGKPQEACAWLTTADQAWRSFDTRWGISPSDRGDEVAAIKQGLADCAN